jgi:hypothetical protein
MYRRLIAQVPRTLSVPRKSVTNGNDNPHALATSIRGEAPKSLEPKEISNQGEGVQRRRGYLACSMSVTSIAWLGRVTVGMVVGNRGPGSVCRF